MWLGNIYGAVYFFDAAKKAGVKPILGCDQRMRRAYCRC
jgi:DNA polymerase III alpha subunit